MPQNEQTQLHIAALKNNCEYLKTETVTPEDLLATYSGNTPLLWGVANSSVSFVLALLDLPDTTHVNVKSTSKRYLNTPLILSVSKGWTHVATQGAERNSQMAIATKLLQKGAEVNAVDVHGRTALHYACLHRNIEAIEALVKAGASWDTKDKNGQNPKDFCFLDVETVSKILRVATGGSKGYTYTLMSDNFSSKNDFYQLLSPILAKDNKFVDTNLLQKNYEFNQKINYILTPLYNHTKKIFNEYVKNMSFEQYELSIIEVDTHNDSLFGLTDPIGGRKLKSLLKIYQDLKIAASANIDCSQNVIMMSDKKEKIEMLINNALGNPDIKAERDLITRIGMAIVNIISIFCAGLPLFANYCITGQIFFSHQTGSEKLLNDLKDEMNSTADPKQLK